MLYRRVRYYLLLVATVCGGSAIIQMWLVRGISAYPAQWLLQFHMLISISLVLSLLLVVFAFSPRAIITLLFMRFVPLALICLPEGANISIVGSLALAYILEIIYYLQVPYNRIFTTVAIMSALGLMLPFKAWGSDIARPTIPDLAAFSVSAALMAILADRHKQWAEKSLSQNDQIKKLGEAILQLTNANIGFQRYADTIKEKSAAEERNRITREIHDTVAYTLVNIMMLTEEASLNSKEDPCLTRLCDQARDQAQAGLNETRRALRLMRETEIRPVQTIEEVKRLVTAFESATGVKVAVEYGNIPFSLSVSAAELIIHMLQEGMANSLRHGRATQIRVHFWLNESELIVNLHDNGTGSSLIQEGIGLSGMRERIAALDGQFVAGNVPDGFHIMARIPYAAVEKTG